MPLRINGDTSGYVQLNAPAVAGTTNLTLPILGFGKVLQVVYGSSTTQVSNNTQSLIDTGVSASITPSSTSSRILVAAVTPVYMADGNLNVSVVLLRGTTQLSVAIQNDSSSANAHQTSTTILVDNPATTSTLTYKTQFRNGAAGTSYVCNQSQLATLVLIEVGP